MTRRRAKSKFPQELVLIYMGVQNMGRPFDRHIDNQELNALVPSPSERGRELQRLSPGAVRDIKRHVESCADCGRKVSLYRQLVNRFSNVAASEAAPPGAGCPNDEDVDWHEVAAGLWPELKAKQLIMHAALCDHCGPLLRAATSVDDDPTPEEQKLLAQLKTPSRPMVKPRANSTRPWVSARLAAVSAVEDICTSGSADGDYRGASYQTTVITDATLWTRVCRIRCEYSPAACSGTPRT